MLNNFKSIVFNWWQGEHEDNSLQEIFDSLHPVMPRYKRHWTSTLAHTLTEFWLKHWQPLSFIIIGILTIITMLYTHLDEKLSNNQSSSNSSMYVVNLNLTSRSSCDLRYAAAT